MLGVLCLSFGDLTLGERGPYNWVETDMCTSQFIDSDHPS